MKSQCGRKSGKAWQVVGGGILGLNIALAGCAKDPPPFDPHTFQAPERSQAGQNPARTMPRLPTTLESPFLTSTGPARAPQAATRPATTPATGPAIYENAARFSLQELVQRAVLNNPEIRVAGYTPAINETRVTEEEARFDPSGFVNANFENTNSFNGGVFNPFNTREIFHGTRRDVYSTSGGVRQVLETGTQAELRYEYQDARTKPPQTLSNPFRSFATVLELKQPLLQNFGAEVNTARIRVARNNQRVSLLDLRLAVEEQVSKLEQAYWQLYQLERAVQIQEELLARTEETARILAARGRGGVDVSRVHTSQANAAVQQRRADVIRIKSQVQDVSDQIKRLVGDPELPISAAMTLLPASPPMEEPVRFNFEDLMNTALAHRPELAQQQMRINTASLVSRVAKNSLLPELNFTMQLRSDGENPLTPFSGDFFSTSAGLEFVVPLGNRLARAQWTRSLLQRQQAIEQYRQLVDQVSLELKQAERAIYTNWLEIGAQRQARFAAADALLAIEQREQADEPLTVSFVQTKLDRQAALAQAQLNEAAAIANYNTAIADLERRKGTILRYNNVMLEEDPSPFVRRVYNTGEPVTK